MNNILLAELIIAMLLQGVHTVWAHYLGKGPSWLRWLRHLFLVPLAVGIVCLRIPLSAYPKGTSENTLEIVAKALACTSYLSIKALIVWYSTLRTYGCWWSLLAVAGFLVPTLIFILVGAMLRPVELVWSVLGVGPGALCVFFGCTWHVKKGTWEGELPRRTKEERCLLLAAFALTGILCAVSVVLTILTLSGRLTSRSFVLQCAFSMGTFVVLIILHAWEDFKPRRDPSSGGMYSTTVEYEMDGRSIEVDGRSIEGARVEERALV